MERVYNRGMLHRFSRPLPLALHVIALLSIAAVPLPSLAAEPLLPDLAPIASEEEGFMFDGEFDTISEPGRVLYRFTTAIANLGDGPFQVFEITDQQAGTQEVFQHVFDDTGAFTSRSLGTFPVEPAPFGHLHLSSLGRYSLREVTPGDGVGDVVATHDKTSHAVVDSVAIDTSLPNAPSRPFYNSSNDNPLGISVGYADLYGRNIPAQRIDITGVPSGEYWLEVIVDPTGYALELTTDNNTARILVDLDVPHPVTIDGDYNADGTVDAEDYAVWRENLGAEAGALPNDPAGGAIGVAQYQAWRASFADTLPSAAANATPEPATGLLVVSLIIGPLITARRRRNPIA